MPSTDLVLRLATIAGAEDLLLEEISELGTAGVAADGVVDLAPKNPLTNTLVALRERRYYTAASARIPELQLEDGLPALITALTVLGVDGPAGYRIDLKSVEDRHLLSTKITKLTGWSEQPADWKINIRPVPGEYLIDFGPLHWSRRHVRLERLPWSTPVVVAEVLVRLAKINSDHRLLDPCCGTGTILIAAGLAGVRSLQGVDHDPAAVEASRTNLDRSGLTGVVRLGSATDLGLAAGSVDRVVTNLPFGKQVGTHGSNQELYPALLKQLGSVLSRNGRAVLFTEDKRLLTETVQRTAGIKIIRERLLRYSGSSPTAYVIGRTGSSRRR